MLINRRSYFEHCAYFQRHSLWPRVRCLWPPFRDRSLFIAWWWCVEDFRGDHLTFRRTKGRISRNWEPKRGIAGNFGRIQKGEHSNCLRKLRHGGGGIAKVIQSYWGDHLSEVTFQRGDRLSFTLFSPKSSAPRPPRPPPPPPPPPAAPPPPRR